MKRLINTIAFVILPIVMGGFIYIISRTKSLKMFNWFQELSLTNEIELVRNHFSNYNFPDWIVYNLPDLLWVFSFTSLLLIIWNMKINKENIAYIIVPMGLGIISELGQLFSIMDGTFDKIDLLFYLLGGLTSVFIFSKLKTNNNEKTITTFR